MSYYLRIIKTLLAAIICAVGMGSAVLPCFAAEVSSVQSEADQDVGNLILPAGVTLQGNSLEGMTVNEVRQWAQNYMDERLNRTVTLTVYSENEYDFTASDLGLTCSNPNLLDGIENYALDGNFVEQYKLKKDLEKNPVDLWITFDFNPENLQTQVSQIADYYYAAPVNARVRKENGQFIISKEIYGSSFDKDAIASELTAMISDTDHTDSIVYDFPATEVAPEYTSEDFNFSSSPLGAYSTGNLGNLARTTNITISSAGINGTLVYPGETVSALEMYGDMTAENGYQLAPGYEDGKQVMTIGGGICQTSTTLYNALLQAELEIVERHAHSMLVTYVPPGLDAAVSPGVIDLKFRNNLNYPIYLESYVVDGKVSVIIWGVEERPAGRVVQYTYQVNSVTFPNPLYTVVDNNSVCSYGAGADLSTKVYAEVEVHPDVTAVSYKVVALADGTQTVTQLNSDHYRAMTGVLYKASDCLVNSWLTSSSSDSAIYRYIGYDIYHKVTFKDGTDWNPSVAGEHYSE